ncbi:MAG: outer membrane beta-barrel protein [Hyphomonadaceae bacterium]
MQNSLKKYFRSTLMLAGASVVIAPTALAQSVDNPFKRDRFLAVTDRYQPEYDPEPVRLGSTIVDSSVGVDVRSDDNVFYADQNPVDDTLFVFTPRFRMRTDWANHELAGGVNVEHREYQDQDSESATDVSGNLRGRLDVSRGFSLNASLRGFSGFEERYAPATIGNAAEPTPYDRTTGEVGAAFVRDRIELTAAVGQDTRDYDNVARVGGGPDIAQDYRDVTEQYLRARASYAVSPNVAVFVQGRAADLDYDQSVPNRDSKITSAQVGLDFELSAPFRGDVAVGYFKDDKKDDANLTSGRDFDGVSIDGNLHWFITELTTLSFSAQRAPEDPGLPNSSSASVTRLGARADHELLRNVLISVDLKSTKRAYEDISREDEFFEGSLGVGYKLNKHARIDASYTRRDQTSSGALVGPEFDQNVFSIGLRLYP